MILPTAGVLAVRLRPLQRVLDARPTRQAWRSAAGDLLIDPAADTRFPSSNGNSLRGLGLAPAPGERRLAGWLDRLRAAGVGRCFAWIQPGPYADDVRAVLAPAGFERFGGTGYPTLVRGLAAPKPVTCAFTIADLDAAARVHHRDGLAALYGANLDQVLALAARRGGHLVAALHRGKVVAAGLLVRQRGLAYLGWMETAERWRKRGAQNALIAERLRIARAAGCDLAVSQTLYLLAGSLRNLQRAGFVISYEQEVWSCAVGVGDR